MDHAVTRGPVSTFFKSCPMFRATYTPPLSVLLDDMFEKNPKKVAKHLGVTVATLKRWKDTDNAPRAALLALFYESRWGYSLLYTTAFNAETVAREESKSLRRTNDTLRVRIARLEALGNFESANEPIWKAM
jgi:hypothetical protein